MQSGALAAACAVSRRFAPAMAEAVPASGKPSPIKLGLASYTFRNFTRAQMIGFMKQLHVTDLNCKDVKDHLPMDPALEAQALADYATNGIKLHAAGAIYFPKNDEDDIRTKFEYCKRAGINVIVAGDPTPESASSGSRSSSRNTTSASPSTITALKTSSSRPRSMCSRPLKTSTRALAAAST